MWQSHTGHDWLDTVLYTEDMICMLGSYGKNVINACFFWPDETLRWKRILRDEQLRQEFVTGMGRVAQLV